MYHTPVQTIEDKPMHVIVESLIPAPASLTQDQTYLGPLNNALQLQYPRCAGFWIFFPLGS